jgi:hypothetical protein
VRQRPDGLLAKHRMIGSIRARVPGPCARLREILLASNSVFLLLPLSPNQAASFVGQGRAGASADPATRTGTSGSSARSWWAAPPLRMTRSLKESELVQLAIRSFGESTRVHSRADLRLPSVRQPWIGFLSEGYSAGFACFSRRSANMSNLRTTCRA